MTDAAHRPELADLVARRGLAYHAPDGRLTLDVRANRRDGERFAALVGARPTYPARGGARVRLYGPRARLVLDEVLDLLPERKREKTAATLARASRGVTGESCLGGIRPER